MANQSMKQHQPTSRWTRDDARTIAEQPWADQPTLRMPCGYDSEALDAAALFEDLQPILATSANLARTALLLPPAPVAARSARVAQPPTDQRRAALIAIGICGSLALVAALGEIGEEPGPDAAERISR